MTDQSEPRPTRVVVAMDDPGDPAGWEVIVIEDETVTNDEAIALARAQRARERGDVEASGFDPSDFAPLGASGAASEVPPAASISDPQGGDVDEALELGLAASPDDVLAAPGADAAPPQGALDEAVQFGPVVPLDDGADPSPAVAAVVPVTARRRSVTGARHPRTPATSRRSAMLVVALGILAISGTLLVSGRNASTEFPRRVAETTPPTDGGHERAGTGIAATETAGVDGIVGTSDDSTVSTGELVAAGQAGPGALVAATMAPLGGTSIGPAAPQGPGSVGGGTSTNPAAPGTTAGPPSTSSEPPPPPPTSPPPPPPPPQTSPPPPPPPPTAPTTTLPLRTTTTTTPE